MDFVLISKRTVPESRYNERFNLIEFRININGKFLSKANCVRVFMYL